MRVTQSNAEKLVIVDFPWLMGGFFLLGTVGFMIKFVNYAKADTPWTRDQWICLGALALMVFCLLFVFKRITFSFDLRLRQLTRSRRSLLTGTSETLPLSQISAVNLEALTNPDGNGLLYRVTLITNKGILPLTPGYTEGQGQPRAIRDAIAQALHLSIQPAVFDTDDKNFNADLRALIARGRTIEAVKQVRMQRRCTLAEAKRIVDELAARSA